jgi:glycosyltransferase involved in cell wall biosynthesis
MASDSTPELSVIVPVHRPGPEIHDLLEGMRTQSLDPSRWELLFVLDGPQPEARKLLSLDEGYDARILELPAPRGSYAARNLGIAQARGANLAFTDVDCRPLPHWLSEGLLALSTHPRVAGAIHMPLDADSSFSARLDRSRFLRQRTYANQGFAATANLFARKEVFEHMGTFPENLVSGGDQIWGKRAQASGFAIFFSDRAEIVHPPRARLSDLVKKAHRVGRGMGQALAQDLVEPNAVLRGAGERIRLGNDVLLKMGNLGLAAATAAGLVSGYWSARK